MHSALDLMMSLRLLGLKSFRHGVHPPALKDETSGLPIRPFPFAPMLIVPLQQHTGAASIPTVREGQEVARGEPIGRPDGFLSVATHAPASGVVRRLAPVPSITGRMVPGVFLEPLPASTQEVSDGVPCPLETATVDHMLRAIQEAGIVGLGGAAFPTHAKLTIPAGQTVDTLVINGAECEPYLTGDHRVMLEQRDDIVTGIRYLLAMTGAARALIGVEANKADAAAHLRAGIPADLPVTVEILRVKYPQGAEKMLITSLLGRVVPSRRLPLDVHAMCVNVSTTAEIGRLLPRGRGICERTVTVTGPAVVRKGNYRIPIGTPLRFVLEQVGVTDDVDRVFLGGPMMGRSVSSLDMVVTKGVTGVVAFTDMEAERTHRHVYPCIRCGSCLDACPVFLNPAELGALARSEDHDRMAADFHLMDCLECGCCSFVCPSHIPLVHQFRVAKAAIRKGASA